MANNQPKLVKVTNGVETPILKEIFLGRQADCDLVLTEGHASRRHAKFSLADGAVWLEDLNSANGTFVNGQRISAKVRLNSGDRLRFDTEEFDFRIPAAAPATADEGKTMFREPDSAVVDAASSGMYKRP